jgi:hypothetical protein
MSRTIWLLLLVAPMLGGCSSDDSSSGNHAAEHERIGGQGKVHFVLVKDSAAKRNAYRQIADLICQGESICIVMFWNDATKVPRSLPMTDSQLNAKVAHYNLNKNTGLSRLLMCAVDGC